MGQPLERPEERFTYADYVTWPDNERWELIDGVPYPKEDPFGMLAAEKTGLDTDSDPMRVFAMTAPSRAHQDFSAAVGFQLFGQLAGKKCRYYPAPFDIRLPELTDDPAMPATVVQPDIVIVCDRSKLDRKGCSGAPDFVLEILSPSTDKFDRINKAMAYARHGVREFWTVDPLARTLQVRLPAPAGPSATGDGWITTNMAAAGIQGLTSVAGVAIDFDAAFSYMDALAD